jgi:hypothetical protein
MTNLDMVDLMSTVVVRVRVKRANELRLRFWLACKLIALAGLILNCHIAIDEGGG